jgi:hypothetical protein
MQSLTLFKSKQCFDVKGLAYLKTTLPHKEVAERVSAHLIPGNTANKWEYQEEEEYKRYTLKNVLGFELHITEDPEFEGCFVCIEMPEEFHVLLRERYGEELPPRAGISDFVFWSLRGIPDMEVVHYHDLYPEKEPEQ